jgi:hypothetical protein
MMYFASIARTRSICLCERLAPLALMDCQAPSNAAIKVRTANHDYVPTIFGVSISVCLAAKATAPRTKTFRDNHALKLVRATGDRLL